jgi:phage gpG-like protein
MARVDIDISVRGLKSMIASLESKVARAQDFTPIFPKAKAELAMSTTANFTSNGLMVGGWAPLDAEYGAWKMTRFPGAPPLVRTGKLFASLTGENMASVSVSPKSFTIGTNVEYAKFHQYGTTKMAKRKILFVPKEFSMKFANDAAQWVNQGSAF